MEKLDANTDATPPQSGEGEGELSLIEQALQKKPFPQNYVLRKKLRVRAEQDIDSQEIRELEEGTIVQVEEISGRRACISKPVVGWCSWRQKNGEILLDQCPKQMQQVGETVLVFDTESNCFVVGKILDYNDKLGLFHIIDEHTRKENWVAPDPPGKVRFLGPAGLDALPGQPREILAQLHPRLKEQIRMAQGGPSSGLYGSAPGMFSSRGDRDRPHPSYDPRSSNGEHQFGRYKGDPGMGRYPREPPMGDAYSPSRSKDEQVFMEKYIRRRENAPPKNGAFHGTPMNTSLIFQNKAQAQGDHPGMRGEPSMHGGDRRMDPRDKRGYPMDPRDHRGMPPPDPRDHRGPPGSMDPRDHRGMQPPDHRGMQPDPRDHRGGPPGGMDPHDPRYHPKHKDFPPHGDRMDPRIDPRMDPRRDPRIDPRRDPRYDPRRGDPRFDPRMEDPRRGGDPRMADHRGRQEDPRRHGGHGRREDRELLESLSAMGRGGDAHSQRRLYEYYLSRKNYEQRAQAHGGYDPERQSRGGPPGPPQQQSQQAPPHMSARMEDRRRREKSSRYSSATKEVSRVARGPYPGGEKQLIILRGFPGAGKTMLAKEITERFGGVNLICSEDRYHWTGGDVGLGTFVFKPEINWQTRDWCAREVIDALRDGIPLVVVDNINYRIIHYEEHIRAAHHQGYTVKILEIVHNPELIPKFRARCKLNLAEEEWLRLSDKWETDPRVQLLYPAFMKLEKEKIGASVSASAENESHLKDTIPGPGERREDYSPNYHPTAQAGPASKI